MEFVCPTCEIKIPRDLSVIIPHTEGHIVELIRKRHPEWAEKDGICKKCYVYYKKQLHPDV
ncbi:MAG: hypothetical protein ABH843_08315 [Candidatus Omnitrophota bacterium]